MKKVLEHIEKGTVIFSQRPLFSYLADDRIQLDNRLRFAPCMAHFVFSFMDINRFILPEIEDSEFQRLINIHAEEDAWHWPWYLQDLAAMGMNPRLPVSDTLRFLWGDATRHSRLLSYRCISLLANATIFQKIAIIETIEMTGKVFLGHTAALCNLWEISPAPMQYFGQNHADCETGHHMGMDSVVCYLESIELDEADRKACCEKVDVLLEFYSQFADEMLAFADNTREHDLDNIYKYGALDFTARES